MTLWSAVPVYCKMVALTEVRLKQECAGNDTIKAWLRCVMQGINSCKSIDPITCRTMSAIRHVTWLWAAFHNLSIAIDFLSSSSCVDLDENCWRLLWLWGHRNTQFMKQQRLLPLTLGGNTTQSAQTLYRARSARGWTWIISKECFFSSTKHCLASKRHMICGSWTRRQALLQNGQQCRLTQRNVGLTWERQGER